MSRLKAKRSMQTGVTAQGEPMVWLAGGMFAVACLMILSLLTLVLWQGLSTLWPRSYLVYLRPDGGMVTGELYGVTKEGESKKVYLRTGNYDVSNQHFLYADEADFVSAEAWKPVGLWTVERKEWGNLYGFPKSLSWMESTSARFAEDVRDALRETQKIDRSLAHEKERLKQIDQRISKARLAIRAVELSERVDLQNDIDEAVAAKFQAMQDRAQGGGESGENPSQSAAASAGWVPSREVSNAARKSIERYAELSLEADTQMVSINEEIAKLEGMRSERVVTFELPITDSLGLVDLDWQQVLRGQVEDWSALQGIVPQIVADEGGDAGTGGRKDTAERDTTKKPSLEVEVIGEGQVIWELDRESNQPTRLVIRKSEDGKAEVFALREHAVVLADIVRFFAPNQMNLFQRFGVYLSRWWEFLLGEPREAGIEGGFFPAIWGTVVMTLIMSLAVMPFGVLAALYMREYAKRGLLLSIIRISINNLAGVPSIVYGVFGLSFFCYMVGGYIDGGPAKAGFDPWPSATWFSALAILAIVGILAFSVALLAGSLGTRGSKRKRYLRNASAVLWLATFIGIVILLVRTPHFHGFYQAQLPNPTFGKGCLLWAACTLALLTLPVVIVATEEALAAVPNSLREGSYACGAGKWQTIHRIVLPYARPGIITGFILAMARGAGEVAPMMLVGAIPLATELPLDLEFPFLHGSRSFMHLGFQIYSLGFQSQNSEAAKPMVFTATLLLLTIVTLLNQTAIWLRARLRKRFQSSQF
jgi:ABC-type phosphate transport system permease subunit